jgi:hypothetical protein
MAARPSSLGAVRPPLLGARRRDLFFSEHDGAASSSLGMRRLSLLFYGHDGTTSLPPGGGYGLLVAAENHSERLVGAIVLG